MLHGLRGALQSGHACLDIQIQGFAGHGKQSQGRPYPARGRRRGICHQFQEHGSGGASVLLGTGVGLFYNLPPGAPVLL